MEDHILLLVTCVLVLAVTGTVPLIKNIIRLLVMIIGIVGILNLNLIPLDAQGHLAFLSSAHQYVSAITFINKKCNIHLPSIDISLAPKSQDGCKKVIDQISSQFGSKKR